MIISLQIITQLDKAKIEYVLDVFNNHPLNDKSCEIKLNQPNADLIIAYGFSSDKIDLSVPRQELVFGKEKIDNSRLVPNAYICDELTVYSVEKRIKERSRFILNRRYGFDWIETLFFHLSRYEEYYCEESQKDEWGMMRETEQFLVMFNLHKIPIVDHIVCALLQTFGIRKKAKMTSFVLTHDIDVLRKFKNPYRFLRSFLRTWLDGHGLQGAFNCIKLYVNVLLKNCKDPYDIFQWLLVEKSNKKVTNKIIYFMSGGETVHDNYYSIHSKAAQSIISLARSREYSIGLHGSFNSSQKEKLFQEEHQKLIEASSNHVHANRQHFLRFDFSKTPAILERNGIKEDSTLGYQRLIGFRCGTGFEYPLFNFKEQRPYNFKERPMIVMDGALWNEAKQSEQKAIQIIESFFKDNEVNTQLTFNFHNTFFDPLRRNEPRLRELYLKLFKVDDHTSI